METLFGADAQNLIGEGVYFEIDGTLSMLKKSLAAVVFLHCNRTCFDR